MRDLKNSRQNTKKMRRNRRKQKRKAPDLRKVLRRLLRVGVALFSTVLIVVGGFFVSQLLLASDLFRVEKISVIGQQRLEQRHVVALSDIEPGVNTFSLDLDLIGRKIEENPWVRRAAVQRIFPRQVRIELQERQPVAIINLGYLYYLDDDGEIFKVLEADDSFDFPVITGFDYERAQEHDEGYARTLKKIVALLQDLNRRERFNLGQISEIHLEKDNSLALFTLADSVKVKLGFAGFTRKLDRLERIYADLKPKLKVLDYIDLNVAEKIIVRIERPDKTAKG